MWYSVVNPRSPGYKNKVVSVHVDRLGALQFSDTCECQENHPFFVISTPTKPSIGEAVNPDDLAEDERW